MLINEAVVLENFFHNFWYGRQVFFKNFDNFKK